MHLKKSLTAIVALVASIALAGPAGAAMATDPLEEMEDAGRAFLTEYDVPSATQDELIAELLDGGTWDSMSGVAPVSSSVVPDPGYTTTVSRFADGSVEVSRVEAPTAVSSTGFITPFAISGCSSTTSGTKKYITNCTVDKWTGVIRLTFKADFTYVTPGYDYIDRVFEKSIFWAGASGITVDEFGVSKKYENAAGPARANLTVIGSSIAGSSSSTLGLRVGAGGAYQVNG